LKRPKKAVFLTFDETSQKEAQAGLWDPKRAYSRRLIMGFLPLEGEALSIRRNDTFTVTFAPRAKMAFLAELSY